MKIVFVVDWHSEKMGYSDNFLPNALARLGHEIHLVSTNHQVYFNKKNKGFYQETLQPFLGPGLVEKGSTLSNGIHVHRLDAYEISNRLFPRGLVSRIRKINPDIIQTGDLVSWQTYILGANKFFFDYKLFSECHTHASVFPIMQGASSIQEKLKWRIFKSLIGKRLSKSLERCYPISTDSAQIVEEFYGIAESKITVRSLGVDTNLFSPASENFDSNQRRKIRESLGISENEILCIYTGRLTPEKKPLLLAQAVAQLHSNGLPFKSLFIGNGPDNYVAEIQNSTGSTVLNYMPASNLPDYYRISDLAVWPSQESTSQLDAMACGLPLILSDKVQVVERIESNGLIYKEGNLQDLAEKIMIFSNSTLRKNLGKESRKRALSEFSWDLIARKYEYDYIKSLNN